MSNRVTDDVGPGEKLMAEIAGYVVAVRLEVSERRSADVSLTRR